MITGKLLYLPTNMPNPKGCSSPNGSIPEWAVLMALLSLLCNCLLKKVQVVIADWLHLFPDNHISKLYLIVVTPFTNF